MISIYMMFGGENTQTFICLKDGVEEAELNYVGKK